MAIKDMMKGLFFAEYDEVVEVDEFGEPLKEAHDHSGKNNEKKQQFTKPKVVPNHNAINDESSRHHKTSANQTQSIQHRTEEKKSTKIKNLNFNQLTGSKKKGLTSKQNESENRNHSTKKDDQNKQKNTKEEVNNMKTKQYTTSQVCLFEPRVFTDAQDIADELKRDQAILVNMHKMEYEGRRRVVDFLSGCVYSLDGDIQRVGQDIFLCTPSNVGVQWEITESENEV